MDVWRAKRANSKASSTAPAVGLHGGIVPNEIQRAQAQIHASRS
jgi:hypothetical protein